MRNMCVYINISCTSIQYTVYQTPHSSPHPTHPHRLRMPVSDAFANPSLEGIDHYVFV